MPSPGAATRKSQGPPWLVPLPGVWLGTRSAKPSPAGVWSFLGRRGRLIQPLLPPLRHFGVTSARAVQGGEGARREVGAPVGERAS